MNESNAIRSQPKFGFGFGAESLQMASFGEISVLVEVKTLPFGFLSVSAETDIDLRSSPKVYFTFRNALLVLRLLGLLCLSGGQSAHIYLQVCMKAMPCKQCN